jgi:BirA family transcriptional regulator, biotin operon repressor / biotin---[acetyl-CoA-carboxylase] ligase
MSMEHVIADAVREAGLGAPVHYERVTSSTNETALRLAADGAPEWTVVVAGHQTAGRGRLGRTWTSEPGQALLCSVVLRPDVEPADVGLLTLLGGVAMAEAARVSCDAVVRCKWPNDLLVSGGKAGGVLAESVISGDRLGHVVLGAGVNVRSAPADVPGATSLGGGDPAVLLSAFLWCFRQRYRPSEPGWGDEVLDAHRAVSATLGERVRAEALDGREIEGTAIDLDVHGNLVVEAGSSREVVGFGEVHHLRG